MPLASRLGNVTRRLTQPTKRCTRTLPLPHASRATATSHLISEQTDYDRRKMLIGMGVVFGSLAIASKDSMAEGSSATATATATEMQQPTSVQEAKILDDKKDLKTVIITGSNSGIGRASALQLAATGEYRIVLACRTQEKAEKASKELQQELKALSKGSSESDSAAEPSSSSSSPFVPMECDLASFKSVRAFAEKFHQSGLKLDVLALNAGVQFSGSETPLRSADGYELTLATNHLGHFLLANLLLPDLEAASSSSFTDENKGLDITRRIPRIVVTASEVHDPASPGGSVGKGAHIGAYPYPGLDPSKQAAMIDGGEWDADKAYKDTKLCNILFAKELNRRLKESGSEVTVNSFGPGLITRSGFFRSQNPLFVGLFDFATNDLFRVAETVEGGGACLTYMITSPSLEGKSGVYFNNGLAGFGGHSFEASGTSEESMDEQEARWLWEASMAAVGLV